MIHVEEKTDVAPLCPHCGIELKEIWCRLLESVFGKRYIYFCSNCKKVLGVTQRKGFWMG